jgi:iron only hydrogenase large subunit-like protein
MKDMVNSSDDADRFLEDLRKGQAISLLIAPAAKAAIEDLPHLLGYLRSLGVRAFYPVLPYADITLWGYYRLFRENPHIKMISSACVGIRGYIREHQGELAEYLCPVFSPLLCTARYLRTYRRLSGPFAFLSPCVLKKQEFNTGNEELIQYNVTIKALKLRIKNQGITVRQYETCFPEQDHNGPGLTLAAFGGIGKVLAALLPELECHVEQGTANTLSYLLNNREFGEQKTHPMLLEFYACPGGCANGSGVGEKGYRDFLNPAGSVNTRDIFELFTHYDKTLNLRDFCYNEG